MRIRRKQTPLSFWTGRRQQLVHPIWKRSYWKRLKHWDTLQKRGALRQQCTGFEKAVKWILLGRAASQFFA